ncbi:TKL family protein kinase [Trichomonas vaginalis G3]|uniref:TKL family protein kinase n=1 Tax=Trichomonas vaginalis (strain ATCC PRA-98 / G3) TaxID=412133 RepID=A2G5H7_TRIV3|nr:protein kinase protein [Trichomonas vaginalis G3]EAX87588.1 TKL family protein kinase [Trichomonas vaginalis G3]KAI5542200.1 protein kinase protein [Trichomonas vaginalis G3]|eukprot:XP_001300518.1 TKL family protein kinase [Trichomonas vaginalis G3]
MDCTSIQDLGQRIPQYLIHFSDFNILKTIGRGGFGEVYMAEHRGTGIICALKKLTVNEQEFLESHQKYFIREVYILSKTQHPFLLQLLGFSVEFPYCIATEFINNGSLYDALHHKRGCPNLSGTNLTIIALVSAMALQSLHKKNIMHRDIKTLNVLLDDKCLPHICDFGISREDNAEEIEEASLVTGDIGTPNWMAPELFGQTHYDNRVDIYAFGIMLWEMLTGEVPYAGKQPFVIMQLVTSSVRPKIPPNTPRPLATLISTCWAQDPNDRVDFGKIAKAFEKHKVEYPGTNPEEVDKFIKDWKAGVYQNTQILGQPQQRPQQKVPQAKPADGLSQLLTNPFDPNFEFAAIQAIQQGALPTFIQLLQLVFTAFQQIQPEITSRLLKALAQLFTTNVRCAEIFIQATAFVNLPYTIPGAAEACNELVEALFQHDQSKITHQLLEFALGLCQSYPTTSLNCLANYISNPNAQFAEEMVRYMIFYADYFKKAENADLYIDTLFFYASTVPNYPYLQNIGQAFVSFLSSGSEKAIETAYRALTEMPIPGVSVPADTLIAHMRFPSLVLPALLYITTMPDSLKISHNLISSIVEHAQQEPLAVYVLCLFAEREDTARELISAWDKWLNTPMIAVADSMRIFLSCMCNLSVRQNLLSITSLALFFKIVIESNDSELLEMIQPTLRKLDVGDDFCNQCKSTSFLKVLLQNSLQQGSWPMLITGLQLVEMLARKFFLPDYLEYVPYALNVIQQGGGVQNTSICVSLIFSITGFPESHETMKTFGLKETLNQNYLSADLMQYANAIFQRLGI